MLSKLRTKVTAATVAVFALSCAHMPWRNGPIGEEVNLSFALRRNLIELQTVRLDNRIGVFILDTAAPRIVIDRSFGGGHARTLQLGAMSTVPIQPLAADISGVADALIGAEAWRKATLTIDYRSGVVTVATSAAAREDMVLYRYRAAPTVTVHVDGSAIPAIVDTSSPDTIVLPGARDGRGTASVQLAGADFGTIDVRYADIPRARIGNRILSHFLVTIDYGRQVVGLWADRRQEVGGRSP